MSPDPFDALRGADTPAVPDPAFAAALKARIVTTLATGAPMTTTTTPENGLRPGRHLLRRPGRAGRPAGAGVLRSAARLDRDADRPRGAGGGVHPDARIGDMGDDRGLLLSYRVDDIAAAVAAARSGGGTATDPVDRGYALESDCRDPAGLRFWLHQFEDAPDPAAAADAAAAQGSAVGSNSYVSLLVPDGGAARLFYAAVLAGPTRTATRRDAAADRPVVG